MGLIDVVVGTAVSGYVTFKLTNKALERIFFSKQSIDSLSKSSAGMLCGSLKDQLVIDNSILQQDSNETN